MIRPPICPTCDKELPADITGESKVFPFCSERCQQVDLHRWFNGDHAIVEPMTMEHLLEAEQSGMDGLDE